MSTDTKPQTRSDAWRKNDGDEELYQALMDGKDATLNLMETAIKLANPDSILETVDAMPDNLRVINGVDALGMVLELAGIQQPTAGQLAAMDDGVYDHIFYHLGRPGECGSACPAFLPFPALCIGPHGQTLESHNPDGQDELTHWPSMTTDLEVTILRTGPPNGNGGISCKSVDGKWSLLWSEVNCQQCHNWFQGAIKAAIESVS